jgi:hypothetical protein
MSKEASQSSSSTFGIIAVVISIVALFTPRLFLSMIVIGIVIFSIIGLVKDKSKVFSIIALLVCGFIFYLEIQRELSKSELYKVSYLVACVDCQIRYTNESGGEVILENRNFLDETVELTGDTYVTLSAINSYDRTGDAEVSIYVNGVLLETKKSSGRGASAFISCMPNEADGF